MSEIEKRASDLERLGGRLAEADRLAAWRREGSRLVAPGDSRR